MDGQYHNFVCLGSAYSSLGQKPKAALVTPEYCNIAVVCSTLYTVIRTFAISMQNQLHRREYIEPIYVCEHFRVLSFYN